MRKLMLQQQKAFDWAKNLTRVALFMEMRLGKTTVAIRWAEYHECKRILVVCTDAIKSAWSNELKEEFTADEDIVNLNQMGENFRAVSASGPGNWFLVTYQSILYGPSLLDLQWDCIILDESTHIRNPQAAITKLLMNRRDNFKCRMVLSGLPDPESRLDYFMQLAFIWDSFMHCCTYWEFRRRYFSPGGYGGYTWECTKFVEDKIKEEVAKVAFVMTRKQAGIGSKKIKTILKVEMNKEQKDLIKQIQSGFEIKALNIDDYGEETKWIPVKYQWEGMVAGGFSPHGILLSDAKAKEILKLMRGELKNEKIVIWCRYTHEIRFLESYLSKNNVEVVTFTGKDKSQAVLFTHGKARAICAQAKCGRYGLDWSASSTEIYYSNWYDGEVRGQSEDRIVHPKKKEPLLIIDVVSEGSIDEDVVSILKKKKLSSRKFMEELAKRRNL